MWNVGGPPASDWLGEGPRQGRHHLAQLDLQSFVLLLLEQATAVSAFWACITDQETLYIFIQPAIYPVSLYALRKH